MNFVFIMTDTQNRDMVGAYGNRRIDTPNLDRLASEGVRFNRAYTACPLCTPARSAIFSGTHPTVNGAWCNNVPPYGNVPLMGTILRHNGYRAAYTGKWHLDGSGYFGDGEPGGGFEAGWWYDGKRYAEDLGPERFEAYRNCRTAADLRRAGFTAGNIWGHRVADRAIDFLSRVGREPFVLAVSFDEPHGPCVAPPEYWEKFAPADLDFTRRQDDDGPAKPELQAIHRSQAAGKLAGPALEAMCRFLGCNSYIDREIGRVIEAVDRLHPGDTAIIYTSDHGDMLGHHGLTSKGPMMYEEIVNVPLIVRLPGGPAAVSDALVSHLDILPTLLDCSDIERPESLHGRSLLPLLAGRTGSVNDAVMLSFTRFAVNHDDWGEFYPIRAMTDGRYKLCINLFDTDEFYDLQADPCETTNRIQDDGCREARDRLHDALLAEMDRIRDPFRSFRWGARPWRSVREPFYFGGKRRPAPRGFAFQPVGLEADGTLPGRPDTGREG